MGNQDLHIENEFYLAQWLDGRLTDAELRKFVSEDDFLAYQELHKGIKAYEDLEQPLDASYQQIKDKIEYSKRQKVRKLYISWTASIAATVILFFGLFTVLNRGSTTLQTAISEHISFTLPDGSEITLNANSNLRYDKKDWDNNRTVYLNGEAFFNVEKGSTFMVGTDNGKVQVIGTQFNVNSNLDYFEISCFEGSVKVMPDGGEEYILTPGNAFRRIDSYPNEVWKFSIASPGWMNGESNFRSVPLKYVISAFEKQYDLKFDSQEIDDSLLFTGSFGHDDIKVALASVFNAMQIGYSSSSDGVIVLSPY
jgi:transmembrane sensor